MTKRKSETFLLFYLSEFADYETENVEQLFCLSESTVEAVLSAIRFMGWPTRWRYDSVDQSSRIEGDDWEKARGYYELAVKELVTPLGCLDTGLSEIAAAIETASNAAAIEKLAQAVELLANRQCCDNLTVSATGGIANVTVQPIGQNSVPIYGDIPYIELGEEEIPEGYADIEEWQAERCRVAHAIYNGWIVSLRNLDTLFSANAIVGIGAVLAAVTGVITFGATLAPIIIAAAAMVAIAGTLYALTLEMEDNQDDIICWLYTSENAGVFVGLYADLLDSMIAAIPASGGVAMAIKTIALTLANTETLNKLYSKISDTFYPEADCSNCGCSVEYDFSDNPFTLDPLTYGVAVSGGVATSQDAAGLNPSTWAGQAWNPNSVSSVIEDVVLQPGDYSWSARAFETWGWGRLEIHAYNGTDEFPEVLFADYVGGTPSQWHDLSGTFTAVTGGQLMVTLAWGSPSSNYYTKIDDLVISGPLC